MVAQPSGEPGAAAVVVVPGVLVLLVPALLRVQVVSVSFPILTELADVTAVGEAVIRTRTYRAVLVVTVAVVAVVITMAALA
jgi:hypothetical protein